MRIHRASDYINQKFNDLTIFQLFLFVERARVFVKMFDDKDKIDSNIHSLSRILWQKEERIKFCLLFADSRYMLIDLVLDANKQRKRKASLKKIVERLTQKYKVPDWVVVQAVEESKLYESHKHENV